MEITSDPMTHGSDPGSDQTSEVFVADGLTDPSAGMVLHRVLALSARTFLMNDLGTELVDERRRAGLSDALATVLAAPPVWDSASLKRGGLTPPARGEDRIERIHQSRVAMRRIRSNLRTFRLLLDPSWGTTLRAELAWYGNELGRTRDLDLLADLVDRQGPDVLDDADVAALSDVVDERRAAAMARISREQAGPRRFELTEQMLVLWKGPAFKSKAVRPAEEVLPKMLERAWRDVRGAARTAKKSTTEVHLHQLRIRLKDLRYGCETVALVAGGPARKTGKAAERLQSRLGDLHDAALSIDWLEALATERPDLAAPARRLADAQRLVVASTRKGWKDDLKDVERRWRSWQG